MHPKVIKGSKLAHFNMSKYNLKNSPVFKNQAANICKYSTQNHFFIYFALFTAQYLQKMVNNDQEAYNLLTKINQFVKNNDIDHRKFESLKIAVLPEKTSFIQFGKEKLTSMSMNKFKIVCARYFNLYKEQPLILMISDFCKDFYNP